MKGKALVAILILTGVGFLWAVLQLFEVRFARGDVYPAYSSFRTDPLGAKAFYESLAALDGLTVTRNETNLEHFAPPVDSTLIFLGTTGLYASELEINRLEQFVRRGGRMVIAFYPQSKETRLVDKPPKDAKATPTPTPSASPDEEQAPVKVLTNRDVAKRWNLKFDTTTDAAKSSAKAVDSAVADPEISWHSALHFKDSGEDWKTIYTSRNFPVVIERTMGAGTMVVAADSFFASNEALRRERHSAFLAWLIGSHHNIIFDETHLGISESPGISTLMRRYHLGGLLAGLAVVAALAVWKNSARLLPVNDTEPGAEEAIIGKESFGGFVNLLRRNIAPSALLPLAIEHWAKRNQSGTGNTATPNRAQAQVDRARQLIEQHPRDVVGAYQQIARAIHDKKWNPHKTT
jgi:hypothetical protein